MEPILSKLQEGVKYPRFERDATKTINYLVEHITKERGVYSSSIEPNPNEHKVWFNTNDNTLNIYENDKWNPIGRQGGSIGDVTLSGETINGNANINLSLNGFISDVTVKDSYFTDAKYIRMGSGAIIEMTPTSSIKYGNIESSTIKNATISGATLTGSIVASGATISSAIFDTPKFTGYIYANNSRVISMIISTGCAVENSTIRSCDLKDTINASGATISGANISGGTLTGIINSKATISGGKLNGVDIYGGKISSTINNSILTGNIDATGATIKGATIRTATIIGCYLTGSFDARNATFDTPTINYGNINDASIGAGHELLYAGNRVLVTYTGSAGNPILMPAGGNIGYDSASLTLCGVTLTGGDFTKLKNLQ